MLSEHFLFVDNRRRNKFCTSQFFVMFFKRTWGYMFFARVYFCFDEKIVIVSLVAAQKHWYFSQPVLKMAEKSFREQLGRRVNKVFLKRQCSKSNLKIFLKFLRWQSFISVLSIYKNEQNLSEFMTLISVVYDVHIDNGFFWEETFLLQFNFCCNFLFKEKL